MNNHKISMIMSEAMIGSLGYKVSTIADHLRRIHNIIITDKDVLIIAIDNPLFILRPDTTGKTLLIANANHA